MATITKMRWRKKYGEAGEEQETDDSVLWINGKATDNLVSPWSGVFSAYYHGIEIGVYDSRKEAKLAVLERLEMNPFFTWQEGAKTELKRLIKELR